MADFICDYYEQGGTLPMSAETRFPVDAQGVGQWTEIVRWLEGLNGEVTPDEIDQQLNLLRNLPQQFASLTCPRVFVSHKSTDKAKALRIAELACTSGFDFWLDVLDPNLAAINPAPSSLQKSIATALIIEMALLNCTHVLAVMTANTSTSQWVPYEYGRCKERVRISNQASAWLEPSFRTTANFPEYLFLGARHTTEQEILDWFDNELIMWKKDPKRARATCTGKNWAHDPTIPLP